MKKTFALAAVFGGVAGVVSYVYGKKKPQVKGDKIGENKRILFLVNHEVVIYNFRLEIIEKLLANDFEVHVSTPAGERVDKLRKMGTIIHDIRLDRHGMNPIDEASILREYIRLIKTLKPLIVFGFTIKPNIYGAIASRKYHIPFVANITGLGTAVENGGMKQRLTVLMYRFAFGAKHGKVQRVFFQNAENEQLFKNNNIASDVFRLLPGSGVNIERFPFIDYPECGNGISGSPVKFAFISRIMAEKGIEQYLDAAETIKRLYPTTEFYVAGFFEPEYDRRRFERLVDSGTVVYDGYIEDVGVYMSAMHCIVHPTYYPEGLSNVLLEASSTGRPIITTDRPGCREVCHNNINGYLIPEQSSSALIDAIEQFLKLDKNQKFSMGAAGRKLVEEKFDRQIVVDAYMREVNKVED